MNTFFFGYLSLKWRRLVRTLFVVGFFWYILPNDLIWAYKNFDTLKQYQFLIIIYIVTVALTSWIIKPFVVKEK